VMPPEPGPAVRSPLNLASAASQDSFYLMLDGQRRGPYTVNQLRTMWQSGRLTSGTYYWQTGMANWQPLANIQVFLDSPPPQGQQFIVNQVNAPVPYPPQYMQMPLSSRSRAGYVLLGLFLGCLGVHNFYAGYSGRGAAQLLI